MRGKVVENVLASIRLERLVASDFFVKGLKARVAVGRTTADLLQEVMRRHLAR